MKKTKAEKKIGKVMGEFKAGTLHSGSKKGMVAIPKDKITSWRVVKDNNDIPYLRPVGFIHKEYQGEHEEAKRKKGTGYIVIVPAREGVSSSRVRDLVAQNKNKELKTLINDYTFNKLKDKNNE